MDNNLDIISSELKALDDELKHFLDKIEPVLYKDNYQIEDIDFLKTIDFQVIEIQSFNKILWPLLETDDEGILLKKSLINNLLSSLLQTKKRVDAIFENDLKTSQDKLNEYKSRFFELGYCIEFIDNFLDDLQRQRIWLFLLFAMSSNNDLFDFNELTRTASKETDLEKRKKLYLDEYDRVYMLWLKNENNFKSRINDDLVEMGECEQYDEEKDEEFQDLKRHYFDFLDKSQKAIESINFQINNLSPSAVLIQKPKRRSIIEKTKEANDFTEILDKNNNLINRVLEKEDNTLSTEQIFESGFVRAFIEEYYEEKIYSYYSDKDRLLYVMCSTDAEKHEVTKKQIEFTKSEIHKLGWEDLSYGYLLSCKQDTVFYFDTDIRFIFWLKRFSEVFQDDTDTFCPVLDTLTMLKDNPELKKKLSDGNGEFWDLIDKNRKPKNQNFMLEDLVELEIDLVNQIEYDIDEYKANNSWKFDFEEYEKYIEPNRAIEDLFNISELFVQLNRLEKFQSFLLLTSQVETKIKEQNIKQTFSKRNRYEEREKVISKFLEAVDGCLTAFLLTVEPDIEYISLITLHTTEFTTALKELYFSDNKNKEEYYIVIHDTISRATFHINDDNLRGQKSEVWGAIIYSLTIANSYASELRFRETNRYFPFPEDIKDDPNPISGHDIKPVEINSPKSIKNKYLPEKEISLSDFLIKKSDLEKLIQIQNNFIHYEGKRMAILIYFLQVEYKIISTISNSKTHSRKKFIQLFKNDSSFIKFQATNKYLDPYSGELNLSTNNDLDADYIDIKEKLTKIIENPVV